MTTNNSPWHCLELVPGCSAPAREWRKYLETDFDAFRDAFLEPDQSKTWPSDGMENNQDQRRLRLNWNNLTTSLCRAFGLQRKAVEMPVPGTRQVGSWSVDAVPVILTIQDEARMFRLAICEIGLRLRAPFILLGPTSSYVDAACQELLANAQARFFALSAHATFERGVLRLRSSPGELFREFTPRPEQIIHEDTARKAFALVKALEHERAMKRPSPVSVFGLYCIDGLSVSAIARKCQCSRGTVLNRLQYIRKKTGADPNRVRQLSGSFENSNQPLSDPRARQIFRKRLIDDHEHEEEEE